MKQRLARGVLRAMGWRLQGARPQLDRYVLIAAPHTSNWDFPLMLLFAAAFDIRVKWMAKHSLFRPPMGWLMRALGGMPVVRHENRNLVETMVEAFAQTPALVLVVPTEGTRGRSDYWKSGFYHIARHAAQRGRGRGYAVLPRFLPRHARPLPGPVRTDSPARGGLAILRRGRSRRGGTQADWPRARIRSL